MKNKTIIKHILLIVFILLPVIIILYWYNKEKQHENIVYDCLSRISVSKNINGSKLVIDAIVSTVAIDDEKGIVRVKGYLIDDNNNKFTLNRSIEIIHNTTAENLFSTIVKHITKTPDDTANDENFNLFINEIYNNIRVQIPINDNTLIFHDTISPQFICVMDIYR